MSLGVSNPKIDDQINRLFSEILIAQQEYSTIRESNPEKSQLLKQKLEQYEADRGRGFFFPLISSGKSLKSQA